jgi:hypothetical protein
VSVAGCFSACVCAVKHVCANKLLTCAMMHRSDDRVINTPPSTISAPGLYWNTVYTQACSSITVHFSVAAVVPSSTAKAAYRALACGYTYTCWCAADYDTVAYACVAAAN